MGRISKYENLVLSILENAPSSRGNDKILYYLVLKHLGFSTTVTLGEFLTNDTFPNWESITRVRRKLQERRPDLLPPEKIKRMRADAEEDFIEYARSNT